VGAFEGGIDGKLKGKSIEVETKRNATGNQ
jgi:hypothetical protein